MIYISKDQLSQVEYLIDQSIQGNHILFDTDTVRHILNDAAALPLTETESYEVEHHIEKLIEQPTLEQKRAFLEQMDSKTFACVVRTYFNIVENNLYENEETRH